jgi:hypothetical protein
MSSYIPILYLFATIFTFDACKKRDSHLFNCWLSRILVLKYGGPELLSDLVSFDEKSNYGHKRPTCHKQQPRVKHYWVRFFGINITVKSNGTSTINPNTYWQTNNHNSNQFYQIIFHMISGSHYSPLHLQDTQSNITLKKGALNCTFRSKHIIQE